MVQIHSPRPTLLELTTYNKRKSGRPHGAVPGARWEQIRSPRSLFSFESIRERQNAIGTDIYIRMNSLRRGAEPQEEGTSNQPGAYIVAR